MNNCFFINAPFLFTLETLGNLLFLEGISRVHWKEVGLKEKYFSKQKYSDCGKYRDFT